MRVRLKWLAAIVLLIPLIVYLMMVRAPRPAESIRLLEPHVTAVPGSGGHPTLTDYWDGRAKWMLEISDTGLPVGESDTIDRGGGVLWSYLHASDQSAGVVDSCGKLVEFPGCVTRWVSTDGGQHFELEDPTCVLTCSSCPCSDEDGISQQQYPRVAWGPGGGLFMVYEHGASAWVTFSPDGLTWYPPRIIRGTGIWVSEIAPCGGPMKIGPHPAFVHEAECMAGGPPGITIDDGQIYVFVGLGQNPGHMGCFVSPVNDLEGFEPCNTLPLFEGAREYGPLDLLGMEANAYFDFRFVTSAEVIQMDNFFYMTYEGIRGPSTNTLGRDDQFGLGFARSMVIDGPWETFEGNPVLGGMMDNWGLGHADVVVLDGITYLYTATPELVRGRYRLAWSP